MLKFLFVDELEPFVGGRWFVLQGEMAGFFRYARPGGVFVRWDSVEFEVRGVGASATGLKGLVLQRGLSLRDAMQCLGKRGRGNVRGGSA